LRGGGDTGAMGMRGMPTNAYGHNIFAGDQRVGSARHIGGDTVEDWRSDLEEAGAFCAQTGWRAEGSPLRDPKAHDFRLREGSAPVDRGVKFFVPWALYGVVGEWHFGYHPANPEVVLGRSFYMTEEYLERHMYSDIPRQNLQVPDATADDYVEGPLEDWLRGALAFDGREDRGVLTHEAMTADRTYSHGYPEGADRLQKGEFPFEGAERRTVDMGANNFLVEAYFRTEPGHVGGTLARKMGESGYALHVNERGGATFAIRSGDAGDEAACGAVVNDGQWHHLIAEADRENGALRIYLDGRQTAEAPVRNLTAAAPLSNTADFVVGEGFAGALDFLRVSRGTLEDAKTTIDELYEWQFNGPFLRDFCGNEPVGRRDAGAIELR
ncbi:MAG: LamG-like jellyroll fold domain-containing protein, partial [Candidatus Brocadiia bacterium]